MKNIIFTVVLSFVSFHLQAQHQTQWMKPEKCLEKAILTDCFVRVNSCDRRIYVGDRKMFWIEQNSKNIFQWRRKFIVNQTLLKCKY